MLYLVQRNAIQPLVDALKSDDVNVKEQASWALGNLAGDGAKTRDLVIAAGAIEPICKHLVLLNLKTMECRNASWALANLCRGKPSPNFAKIKPAVGVLAKVVIENDLEEVLVDVCWALSYICD